MVPPTMSDPRSRSLSIRPRFIRFDPTKECEHDCGLESAKKSFADKSQCISVNMQRIIRNFLFLELKSGSSDPIAIGSHPIPGRLGEKNK
jgi:hypothetical protein